MGKGTRETLTQCASSSVTILSKPLAPGGDADTRSLGGLEERFRCDAIRSRGARVFSVRFVSSTFLLKFEDRSPGMATPGAPCGYDHDDASMGRAHDDVRSLAPVTMLPPGLCAWEEWERRAQHRKACIAAVKRSCD